MTLRSPAAIAVSLILTLAGAGAAAPAAAGIDLDAAGTCVSTSLAAGAPPTGCVDAAQAACLDTPEDTPSVAALCFVEAKEAWSAGIRDLVTEMRATAPEDLQAIIGIEVKYDLLSALVQCDRMEELARAVGTQTGEEIGMQKQRCAATASGLTYVRLKARLEMLE